MNAKVPVLTAAHYRRRCCQPRVASLKWNKTPRRQQIKGFFPALAKFIPYLRQEICCIEFTVTVQVPFISVCPRLGSTSSRATRKEPPLLLSMLILGSSSFGMNVLTAPESRTNFTLCAHRIDCWLLDRLLFHDPFCSLIFADYG